jgi:hypothetical protein
MAWKWHGTAWLGKACKWHGNDMACKGLTMAWKWKWRGMELLGNEWQWNDNGMASISLWDWVWEGPLSPCVL